MLVFSLLVAVIYCFFLPFSFQVPLPEDNGTTTLPSPVTDDKSLLKELMAVITACAIIISVGVRIIVTYIASLKLKQQR